MSEGDENIRSLARSIEEGRLQDIELRQAAELARLESANANEQLTRNRIDEIVSLCGRFTVWAGDNNIRYNSHSVFAPGWLLGHYEGPPSYSFGMHGMSISGSSGVSLLVNRSSSIREIVISSATKKAGGPHLFSRHPRLKNVPIDTIHASIAKFSADYQVEWE